MKGPTEYLGKLTYLLLKLLAFKTKEKFLQIFKHKDKITHKVRELDQYQTSQKQCVKQDNNEMAFLNEAQGKKV